MHRSGQAADRRSGDRTPPARSPSAAPGAQRAGGGLKARSTAAQLRGGRQGPAQARSPASPHGSLCRPLRLDCRLVIEQLQHTHKPLLASVLQPAARVAASRAQAGAYHRAKAPSCTPGSSGTTLATHAVLRWAQLSDGGMPALAAGLPPAGLLLLAQSLTASLFLLGLRDLSAVRQQRLEELRGSSHLGQSRRGGGTTPIGGGAARLQVNLGLPRLVGWDLHD